MFGLGHMDMLPVVYGVVIFLGLWSMWHKITHGQWRGFFIELAVFALVFKLHGGSMSGAFAATIAALISGRVFTFKRSTHE